MEILVFEVAGERHGLAAPQVREVLPAVPLLRVEGAPRGIEGVINLRGQVLPVLDLRAHLGLPSTPIQYTDHLIVAEVDGRLVALRVDRAVELAEVSELEDARRFVPGLQRTARVAKLPTGLVLVHDPSTMLTQNLALDWQDLVERRSFEATR